MPDIVLTTLNARYIHASFGLRYLLANMGSLSQRSTICEFSIKQDPMEVVSALLAQEPQIIGLGVYIWNVEPSLRVVSLLREIAPQIRIVLGGPEVSYEQDQNPIVELADVVIGGEADLVFAEVCTALLAGEQLEKIHQASLPEMSQVRLPYHLYNDEDIANRIIYVEASRGCPFRCEFCLSSLDIPVRRPDEETFLAAMDRLHRKGVRHFKFVDRTFNLNLKVTRAILDFFLARPLDDLFLHFEMVPDRLPAELKAQIQRFPAGVLQFEVGIQTFNSEVATRISLKRDYAKVAENLRFLREETGVHVHADLIVGLPGEDIASFAAGFDRLIALQPQEIQVGILKRLRGTPIIRHDQAFVMRWASWAPYELLCNSTLSYAEMQSLRRFSKAWDRVANSGHFPNALPLLWQQNTPFAGFLSWTNWLYDKEGRVHSLNLERLTRLLFDYLMGTGVSETQVGTALAKDYFKPGRSLPRFLQAFAIDGNSCESHHSIPARQARHLTPSSAPT